MTYNFKVEDVTRINDRFGEKFYTRVCESIDSLVRKWQIDELQLIESFSASLVFKGFSRIYGAVVMKYSINRDDFLSEVSALKYFDGRGCCKLIDVDIDNKVLLEESLLPGIELSKEEQLEKRLDVFCDLYYKLHLSKDKQEKFLCNVQRNKHFKTYRDWVFRITDYMENQENWNDVTLHMMRAKELYKEIAQEFAEVCLLHGNFHYYNILKAEDNYKVIDPKGVVGNPIFDIPRYVLNEFWDEEDKEEVDVTIEKIFDYLSHKLKITKEVLSKLIYIEGTMAICWCVESGAIIDDETNFLNTLDQLLSYVSKHGKTFP